MANTDSGVTGKVSTQSSSDLTSDLYEKHWWFSRYRSGKHNTKIVSWNERERNVEKWSCSRAWRLIIGDWAEHNWKQYQFWRSHNSCSAGKISVLINCGKKGNYKICFMSVFTSFKLAPFFSNFQLVCSLCVTFIYLFSFSHAVDISEPFFSPKAQGDDAVCMKCAISTDWTLTLLMHLAWFFLLFRKGRNPDI